MRNKDGSITFGNNRKWIQKEVRQSRTKRVVDMYCKMLLKGEVDFDKLGKLYRIDQKEPSWSIKRLLKQKEIKEMIDKKLEDILIGEGVTQQYLIDKRKEIINLAKDKDKLDIMLKSIEGFEDMYNMRNPHKEVKQLTQSINYKQLLDSGETNELKLSQTTEEPLNEPIDTTKDDKE